MILIFKITKLGDFAHRWLQQVHALRERVPYPGTTDIKKKKKNSEETKSKYTIWIKKHTR